MSEKDLNGRLLSMGYKRNTPANEIVAQGVDAFPENKQVIETMLSIREPLSAAELLADHHPKYHGNDKPGCLLVRVRREKTYQEHYLDIYGCLLCGLGHECLRSGWEIGWWGGTESKTLSSKRPEYEN